MKDVMPFPRHTSRQRALLSISVAVGQTPAYAVRQPIYRASVSRGLPVCVTAFDSTNLYHLVTQIRGREKKLMPESAVARRSQIHDNRVVNRMPRPTDH